MMYLAIALCPSGSMREHPKTHELRTVEVGECETKQDAIDNACLQLNCRQLFRGVIGRPKGQGGYLVLNAQEYAEV
ncbi:hypothetical protein [Moritella viscosa]|uniref:Hypothetical bacteriophage protein n=2 Tax=Moritella viscosa TaxID=80854 RepID=A0ABY1HA35_9GAMM|nr:hypothetical protein [Moritella viscosa]SGY87712.1 Hypothetical bacteriophage protein [Moritella viscosa]SHO25429.1 Hypothetical bacteriophage protein [Moritella viscosa]